jgi:GntP family gluconate:H+ symporter
MNPVWILLIGMLVVVGGVLVLRLHAFLALILGAILVAALTPNQTDTVGARVAQGFATTAKDVAIVIAMAAIVGEGLLVSGAAERIVLTCRRLFGDRHVPLAFLVSAFILGIPLFTVFYLLIPLAKVMRVRSGRDYLLYVLSIVAGMTMTHSLVPPAPGPLFVAAALKIDLLTMMAGGAIVAACTAIVGYAYALWANRRWDLPLRDLEGNSADSGGATVGWSAHVLASDGRGTAGQASRDTSGDPTETTLPSLRLSLAPIVLPVVLIAAGAAAATVKPAGASKWLHLVRQIGEKNVALTIAAAVGLYLIASRTRGDRAGATKAVGEALKEGGVIILITAAGGAFGYVLRQTDIAESLKHLVPVGRLSLLPLAWLVAVLIRTAQGSATVAIITTAGIVAPLAGSLGFHPVYLALAIGCGSKPVMWMNDSGFWIICKVSGFTEGETLKSATVMSAIMGVAGLGVVMAGAWLLPML